MRPRFEADVQCLSGTDYNGRSLSPDTYDAGDEQFAVGLAQNGRFIVEGHSSGLQVPDPADLVPDGCVDNAPDRPATIEANPEQVRAASTNPAWRQEITS